MSASEPARPYLRVQGLLRTYEDFTLGPLSFDLGREETLAILGPNGSGKSTLLRLIAGLESCQAGRIELRGEEISQLPPHRRSVGMVFQDLALFPQRTVWENITYGLVVRHLPKAEVERRGEELLGQFRLMPLEERLPHELSGGERQRVALARALAPRPALLLFDEPLSAADPQVARSLQAEIRGFLRGAGIPAVYVTHDQEEGFFMADRVGLLDGGAWRQEGPSQEVYEHPRTPFVARFLGYNVLPASEAPGAPVVAVPPSRVEIVAVDTPGALRGVLTTIGGGPRPRAYVEVGGGPGSSGWEPVPVEVLLPSGPTSSHSLRASWTPGQAVGLLLHDPVRLEPASASEEGERRVSKGDLGPPSSS